MVGVGVGVGGLWVGVRVGGRGHRGTTPHTQTPKHRCLGTQPPPRTHPRTPPPHPYTHPHAQLHAHALATHPHHMHAHSTHLGGPGARGQHPSAERRAARPPSACDWWGGGGGVGCQGGHMRSPPHARAPPPPPTHTQPHTHACTPHTLRGAAHPQSGACRGSPGRAHTRAQTRCGPALGGTPAPPVGGRGARKGVGGVELGGRVGHECDVCARSRPHPLAHPFPRRQAQHAKALAGRRSKGRALALPMGWGSVVEVGKWPFQSRRPNRPRQPLWRSAVLGRHHGTRGWPLYFSREGSALTIASSTRQSAPGQFLGMHLQACVCGGGGGEAMVGGVRGGVRGSAGVPSAGSKINPPARWDWQRAKAQAHARTCSAPC